MVSIEAENFHSRSSQTASDAWEAVDVEGISQSRCVEIGPEDGDHWTTNVETTAPYVDYLVQFPSAGSYFIYVRADPGMTGRSSDSCFVAVDRAVNPTELTFGVTRGVWRWTEQVLTVDVDGVHTISIYAREDGLRVDKLVVSSSQLTLMGNGPPQSNRVKNTE